MRRELGARQGQPWSVRRRSALAVLGLGGALATTAALNLLAPAAGLGASSPTQPSIPPRHGQPFRPSLGDWEGSVNGYPMSFELVLGQRGGAERYSLGSVAVLVPASCPITPGIYTELLVGSTQGSPLGRHGDLGLTRFGLPGRFSGARTAAVSGRYHSGKCAGTLHWRLHPARRAPVADGNWRLSYSDGESSRFRVLGGGRLAAGLRLPKALARCNGTTGALDLFIGPAGRAGTVGPHVRTTARFGASAATGAVNGAPSGCPSGPIGFTARRS